MLLGRKSDWVAHSSHGLRATAVFLVAGGVLAASACGGSGSNDAIDVTGEIAFVSDIEPLQDQSPTSSAVFITDADGENSRRLTEPGHARDEVGWFAWSPDGDRIAYAAGEGPRIDLFVAAADGSDARRLASFPSPAGARRPVWSPDGTQIAFDRHDDGSNTIFLVRADGTGLRQLTSDSDSEWHPVWLKGGRIAFVNGDGIATIDTDGGDERQLGSFEVMSAATQQTANIAASADGTSIAYVGSEGGLWVINADGTGRRLLYGTPRFSTATPVWSPDGSRIAFEQFDVGHNSEIFVAGVDGTGARNVSENESHDRDPAWSSDGRAIAFVSERPEGIDVYLVRAEGGPAQNLTDSRAEDGSPAWRP